MIFKIIIAVCLILVVIVCVWALIKTSAYSEKLDEELFQKYVNEKNAQHKNDILSDLEQQTIDKLINELDILLFEKNNNENITIGECEDKFINDNTYTIINDGRIFGFTL